MARKPSARVVLNRAALTRFGLAVAAGVEEIARTAIEVADPPDATPHGAGLVNAGGWLVFVDGKKVAGGSLRGTQPKKPRGVAIPAGVVGLAGWPFPARFQEGGTVDQPARPFFAPAANRTAGAAPAIMRSEVGRLR